MRDLKRNSSLELLRILLMIGIIFLHFNNILYGNALNLSSNENHLVLLYFESLFICCVNVFLIITGYYMCNNNKRTIYKPIYLLFQVLAFQLLFYLIRVLFYDHTFSKKSLAISLLPCNYFVVLYIVLFFISPLLNYVICKLQYKNLKRVFILLLVIFSVGNIFYRVLQEILNIELTGISSIGSYGDQSGYSIVNFVFMYYVGAYIKISESYINRNRFKCILIVVILSLLIFLGSIINTYLPVFNGPSAGLYDNPLVILLAMYVFLIFKDMKFKSWLVNELAKGAFTVFLVHIFFIRFIPIQSICNLNWILMIICLFVCAICLYLLGGIIYRVYYLLTFWIFKLISTFFPIVNKDIYKDFIFEI